MQFDPKLILNRFLNQADQIPVIRCRSAARINEERRMNCCDQGESASLRPTRND